MQLLPLPNCQRANTWDDNPSSGCRLFFHHTVRCGSLKKVRRSLADALPPDHVSEGRFDDCSRFFATDNPPLKNSFSSGNVNVHHRQKCGKGESKKVMKPA